ncbi:MAG TPA: DUF2804 domain-containing protein [Candidatus Hydrogenedentes bacterium]|nr:DUF2804 domain-containing protein [Candidatus Hydrogenedentota bacterium]
MDLCLKGGVLNPAAVGWSRHPLHRCNLSGRWPRKKRWDYWCVMSPAFAFSVTVASIDYLGIVGVYLLDFQENRCFEAVRATPAGRGIHPGERVGEPVRFSARAIRVEIEDTGAEVRMDVRWPGLARQGLEAGIIVRRPPGHETLNVVVPWDTRRFQFTSKQTALPAAGRIRLGARDYDLPETESFAVLDFGRGIWPWRTVWNWAACTARSDASVIGLNFGGQWTDRTGATENGICRDGRLSKIQEPVRFDYDSADFMKPWRIRTEDSEDVDLSFVPFYERKLKTHLLVAASSVHQMFGRFNGRVRAEGVETIIVDGLGWAEEHVARW